MVDFRLDDQQVEFRSQFRAMLEQECTPADLRAFFDGDAALTSDASRTRWSHLAEMGVVGLLAGESVGGLGLGIFDLAVFLEEAGRAGLPEPLLETAGLVVPFLSESSVKDSDPLLESIAGGELIATIGPGPDQPIPWAEGSDVFVVRTPEGFVVARLDEVDISPVGSIDPTRRQGIVSVRPGAGIVVGDDSPYERLKRRAEVLTASELLGVADRMIAFACEHALNRQQFGKPIGSFQAVKHLLANAYVRLEMARPTVYWAAASLDRDVDAASTARDCSMAKALASEAATEAARASLQVHGAMGYTWEHDLQMWMKRAWVLAASWGDASSHFRSVLSSLVD